MKRFLIPFCLIATSASAMMHTKELILLLANKSAPPALVLSQNFLSAPTIPTWLDYSATTGNRMMFDSTGVLTFAPNNMIKASNTFTDANWNNTSITVTPGVADPFGGTAASTITATAVNANLYQGATFVGQNAMSTLWMRRRTGSGNIQLYLPTNVGQVVTLTGSWQQFTKIAAVPAGTGYCRFLIATSGDAIDVYGATLSSVTYESSPRAADAVITTTAAYYGPRLDYPGGSIAGLLIEEPRTNIALWASDLTNAAWVKTNITPTLNQTGIDGLANSATSITATVANGTVLQSVTLASSTRFQSAWVKRLVGAGTINMTTDGGATWTAITVTAGWTKVSIPAQTVTNPSFGFQIVTLNDSIAVDYVQNESGSFATSPIFTTTAAVTRPADIAKLTGSALSTVGGSSGTVLQEINLEGNTAANQYELYGNTVSPLYLTGALGFSATNGSTVLSSGASAVVGTPIRAGLAWDNSGRSISVNGAAAVSDLASFGNIGTTVFDGSNSGATVANGWVRGFGIYTGRLSGSTFTAKTTTGAAY